jgi:hypothetical protein
VLLPVFDAIIDKARLQDFPVVGRVPRKFDSLTALSSGQSAVAHSGQLFFTCFDGPRSTAKTTWHHATCWRDCFEPGGRGNPLGGYWVCWTPDVD